MALETTVAVIAGGLSFEREISLRSGRRVADALRDRGYGVTELDADEQLVESLRTGGADAVFLALHGRFGEDGTVAALLELLGLPYTGSTFDASRLAFDKLAAKSVLGRAGLAVPTAIPVAEGALRELALAVVDGLARLPAVEIRPKEGWYDFAARYTHGAVDFRAPAEVAPSIAEHCFEAATSAHLVLGCRDLSRVDAILDADGTCWILEVNTGPGLTSTSLVPIAADAAGISFEDLAVHHTNAPLVPHCLERYCRTSLWPDARAAQSVLAPPHESGELEFPRSQGSGSGTAPQPPGSTWRHRETERRRQGTGGSVI